MRAKIIVAFDLETTGFSPAKAEILELGLAVWDPVSDITLTGSALFRPSRPIPQHITDLTGISAATLAQEGTEDLRTALRGLKQLTAREDVLLVGHNARAFDYKFIAAQGVRMPERRLWDTLLQFRADLSRKRLPTFLATQTAAAKYGVRLKTNLAAAGTYYRCPETKGPSHRALADALRSLEVFKAQVVLSRFKVLQHGKQ